MLLLVVVAVFTLFGCIEGDGKDTSDGDFPVIPSLILVHLIPPPFLY
jgi:hypothetical protein